MSAESDAGADDEEPRLGEGPVHAVAALPPVSVSREDVPEEVVAKEREVAAARGRQTPAVEKIIAGKLEKYYATSCLMEQSFVKNPDQAVKDLLAEKAEP